MYYNYHRPYYPYSYGYTNPYLATNLALLNHIIQRPNMALYGHHGHHGYHGYGHHGYHGHHGYGHHGHGHHGYGGYYRD